MDFGPGTYALGWLAGVLSTLSPCVLPLIPILLASALGAHRRGPMALAAGLSLSFSLVGLMLATAGAALGLDGGPLRQGAAVLLVLLALVLLSSRLQEGFARATARLGAVGEGWLSRLQPAALTGWPGQFIIGLVLGVVWSPCVGPTLGAASTLASQGRNLPQVALLMLVFGLGAGTPLVVLGALSRSAFSRWRGRLLAAGRGGKRLLGALMLLLGVALLTGWDKPLEAWLVDVSPAWLTALTTRF